MTTVVVAETQPRRSPVLGIIAFAVALVLHLAATVIFARSLESFFNLLIFWLPVLGGLTGLGLGLLAIFWRRGRIWGIAAISVAIAGNSYVHAGLFELFNLLFRAIFGTVVY